MLPRLNGHFIYVLAWFVHDGAILSCDILDFGQQLFVCVDGIIQDKATE